MINKSGFVAFATKLPQLSIIKQVDRQVRENCPVIVICA
jgi:hypothetical protein